MTAWTTTPPAPVTAGADGQPGEALLLGLVPVVPELPRHLREWRTARGLTQGDVARRLRVARTTVRNWEEGRRPQPLQLAQLACLLGWDEPTARAAAGRDRVRTELTSGGAGASPLCRARLAAGLTMTQVATRTGVSPATVSRWENGRRRPSPAYLPALARVLRVTPEQVVALLDPSTAGRSERHLLAGLGELRRATGWTQRAFAAALGIGTSTANRWEHGRAGVPVDRVPAVAGLLGLAPADLLERAARASLPRAEALPPLARFRIGAGMTQQEAAHVLGVSVRTLRRCEYGRRGVDLGRARDMARCYRRPLAQVLRAARTPVPEVLADPRWTVGDLPAVLEALRGSSGLSAAELGRRLGISGRQVRGWELGTAVPPRAACQRLELLFRLPPERLCRLRGAAD
jgi:transcriptional regulator with XRE-family HTH domain